MAHRRRGVGIGRTGATAKYVVYFSSLALVSRNHLTSNIVPCVRSAPYTDMPKRRQMK